ncbi:MAG: DUF2461 domain-containing protein [Bacteroidota bacterium]
MKSTLKFLSRLKKNNRKDWFDEHREDYEIAREELKKLVGDFYTGISITDLELSNLNPSKCIFRINRDIRFSANKSPYKTNMGAWLNRGGKNVVSAGYYLHIEPGNSFLAGGIWMPPAEELRKIRQEIEYNGDVLKSILNDRKFKSAFGGMDPEYALKTAPKGYPKDHPDIALIRHTSFICWHGFNDEQVVQADFVKKLLTKAQLLTPFNRFLNTALD